MKKILVIMLFLLSMTVFDYLWYRIKSYRNGILVIQNYYTSQHKVKDRNYYFAWDTKYKTMVEVDRELNIIEKIKRKIDRPVN